MKKIRRVIIIFCLFIIYCYVINIDNFPRKILLYNDSKLDYILCPFLSIKGETQAVSSGKSLVYNLKLALGDINIKDIEIKKTEKIEVVPCGELVGLKIFTKGVVIVGFSQIEDMTGNLISLEDTTSLEKGEKILEVNGTKIDCIEDLKKIVIDSKENDLKLKVENSFGETREELIKPIHDSSNSYKLGLWVKDSSTGVGTLSFYIPETNQFACLGHGIIDDDSNTLLEIEEGNLTSTKVLAINKGSSGSPGEIRGTINPDDLGNITVNSNFGIFGNLSKEKQAEFENSETVPVALKTEIELGEAKIISDFSGELKEYKIMVDRVYLDDVEDNKSFVIRIIDEELVNKTRWNY